MKNEIMIRLNALLRALNEIEVKGSTNLGNLSGSIRVVEELIQMAQAIPEPVTPAPPINAEVK